MMEEFESRIIPECYADTLLISLAGYKNTNHQHSGIGQVANLMKKNYNNKKVIGVIDNDKNKPSYFDSFKKIKESNNLIVKHKEGTQHYLIIVSPAFEKWIEMAGDEKKVRRPYPNDAEFKRKTKDRNVDKDTKITNYINDIKQKKSPAFLKLQEFIEQILKGDFENKKNKK